MTPKRLFELQDKRDYIRDVVQRLLDDGNELADFFVMILATVEEELREAGLQA